MKKEWWYIVVFTSETRFITRILDSALDLMRRELEEDEAANITITSHLCTIQEALAL